MATSCGRGNTSCWAASSISVIGVPSVTGIRHWHHPRIEGVFRLLERLVRGCRRDCGVEAASCCVVGRLVLAAGLAVWVGGREGVLAVMRWWGRVLFTHH